MSAISTPTPGLASSSSNIIKYSAVTNSKIDMAANDIIKDKSQMTKTQREMARKLANAEKKAKEQDMLRNAAKAKAASELRTCSPKVSQVVLDVTTLIAKGKKNRGLSRKNNPSFPVFPEAIVAEAVASTSSVAEGLADEATLSASPSTENVEHVLVPSASTSVSISAKNKAVGGDLTSVSPTTLASSTFSDRGEDTGSANTSEGEDEKMVLGTKLSHSQRAQKVREALMSKEKGLSAVLGGEKKPLDSKLRKNKAVKKGRVPLAGTAKVERQKTNPLLQMLLKNKDKSKVCGEIFSEFQVKNSIKLPKRSSHFASSTASSSKPSPEEELRTTIANVKAIMASKGTKVEGTPGEQSAGANTESDIDSDEEFAPELVPTTPTPPIDAEAAASSNNEDIEESNADCMTQEDILRSKNKIATPAPKAITPTDKEATGSPRVVNSASNTDEVNFADLWGFGEESPVHAGADVSTAFAECLSTPIDASTPEEASAPKEAPADENAVNESHVDDGSCSSPPSEGDDSADDKNVFNTEDIIEGDYVAAVLAMPNGTGQDLWVRKLHDNLVNLHVPPYVEPPYLKQNKQNKMSKKVQNTDAGVEASAEFEEKETPVLADFFVDALPINEPIIELLVKEATKDVSTNTKTLIAISMEREAYRAHNTFLGITSLADLITALPFDVSSSTTTKSDICETFAHLHAKEFQNILNHPQETIYTEFSVQNQHKIKLGTTSLYAFLRSITSNEEDVAQMKDVVQAFRKAAEGSSSGESSGKLKLALAFEME